MIVTIPCTQLLNEKLIRKEQNYLAVTELRRALANKGMDVKNRLTVDFRTKPGFIMASSYPPVMWTKNMKTMSFRGLDTKEYKEYVGMRDHWRKTGGIKVRQFDENTNSMRTMRLSESGIIF